MQNNRSASLILYFTFLVSPFFSLLLGSGLYKKKIFANLIWFFCAYAGYNFVIGNEGSDINRYKERFIIHSTSRIAITDFIKETIDKGDFDFLQPTISFIISKITDDFRIVLLIIGGIYGFFFSRNIWVVLNVFDKRPNRHNILFLIIFSSLFAFWDINVMRFTLATHIFLYGWILLNFEKRKLGYFFLLLAIFFHFSFTIIVILTLISNLIASKYIKYLFALYIISFFISEISISFYKEQLNFLPEIFQSKSESFLNEEYAQLRIDKTEEKSFIGKYYQDSMKYGVLILMIHLFYIRYRFIDNQKNINLLAFCFLCLGVFNVLNLIPSMNRFLFVTYLFVFVLFYHTFQKGLSSKDKSVIAFAYPFMIIYILTKIRIGFEFTSVFTYLGGPISTNFVDDVKPLIDYIK